MLSLRGTSAPPRRLLQYLQSRDSGHMVSVTENRFWKRQRENVLHLPRTKEVAGGQWLHLNQPKEKRSPRDLGCLLDYGK